MVLVRVAVGLVDAGVIVTLFAAGNIGAAMGFLLIGVPVTFFIARWVALVVAAPFMIAGEPRPVRATSNARTNARQAERDHIYATLASDDAKSRDRRTKHLPSLTATTLTPPLSPTVTQRHPARPSATTSTPSSPAPTPKAGYNNPSPRSPRSPDLSALEPAPPRSGRRAEDRPSTTYQRPLLSVRQPDITGGSGQLVGRPSSLLV